VAARFEDGGVKITVADAIDPRVPPDRRISTLPDFDRPWSDLLKVEIEVVKNETLGDLLRRAGSQLDQLGPHGSRPEPWAPTYFGIYVAGRRTQMWNELTFIDGEGHVRWNHRWQDEPYSELLRSIEAGALPGDPTRLYFIRMGGVGDGVVSSFPEFFHLSHIWWDVLKVAYEAGGVLAMANSLINWADAGEKATEVGEAKADDWKASGGQPYKIQELIRRSTGWDPAQFARLMDVSEADARALLASFGGKEGADGRWHIGDDEVSKLMADNMFLILSSPHITRDAFRAEIQKRLDTFLETGKAPDVDWENFAKLPLDPNWSANRAVEVGEAEGESVPGQASGWRERVRAWFRRRRR
jgi:hypothetical protein